MESLPLAGRHERAEYTVGGDAIPRRPACGRRTGSRFALGLNAPLPSVLAHKRRRAPLPRQLNRRRGVRQFPVPIETRIGRRLLYGAHHRQANIYTMVVNVTPASRPAAAERSIAARSPLDPDGSKLAVQRFGQGRATIWLADSGDDHLHRHHREFDLNGFSTPWFAGRLGMYTSNRTGTSTYQVLRADEPPRQAHQRMPKRWTIVVAAHSIASIEYAVARTTYRSCRCSGEAQRVTDDALSERLPRPAPRDRAAGDTTGRDRGRCGRTPSPQERHRLTPDSLRARLNVSSRGQVEVAINRGRSVSDIATMPIDERIILHDTAVGLSSPDGRAFVSSSPANQGDAWAMDTNGVTCPSLTS